MWPAGTAAPSGDDGRAVWAGAGAGAGVEPASDGAGGGGLPGAASACTWGDGPGSGLPGATGAGSSFTAEAAADCGAACTCAGPWAAHERAAASFRNGRVSQQSRCFFHAQNRASGPGLHPHPASVATGRPLPGTAGYGCGVNPWPEGAGTVLTTGTGTGAFEGACGAGSTFAGAGASLVGTGGMAQAGTDGGTPVVAPDWAVGAARPAAGTGGEAGSGWEAPDDAGAGA
jgi:hypothetical protein